MEAVKSIKSELHDDNNDPIKTMSQIVWVERVIHRYNSCRHDTDLLQMARQTEKYKVQIPYGDSWGYVRQFFSIPISEGELEKTAKKLFKAMIAAKKAMKPQFFDYKLTALFSYFDEPVRIYFELVVDPEFRQISIQRMELLPYNEWHLCVKNEILIL